MLSSSNYFHIWWISLQMSYGDTCQILTWYLIYHQCIVNGEKSGSERDRENLSSIIQTRPTCNVMTVNLTISWTNVSSQYDVFITWKAYVWFAWHRPLTFFFFFFFFFFFGGGGGGLTYLNSYFSTTRSTSWPLMPYSLGHQQLWFFMLDW